MVKFPYTFAVILLLITVSTLSAQSPGFELRIEKVDIQKNINSPQFTSIVDQNASATSVAQQWFVIFVRYELLFDPRFTAPKDSLDNGKWLDNVEVNWEFLYKPHKAPNVIQNYIRFGKEVKYKNLGEGKHTAAIFISPKTLKRYFNESNSIEKNLMMRFSIKVAGLKRKLKIGKQSYDAAYFAEGKLTKKGDSLAQYFDTDKSRSVPNIVKAKNETPFSAIQFDQFNEIQK